ncbi:hypothetical protein [Streptomyces griseoluteus]
MDLPGAAEGGDHFGVAPADTNGDGKADLAVGATGDRGEPHGDVAGALPRPEAAHAGWHRADLAGPGPPAT